MGWCYGFKLHLVINDVGELLACRLTVANVDDRVPVTGIILVTEMTASFTLLLPMLSACFAAMLVPILLRDAPIYESLRERTLRIQEREKERADTKWTKSSATH